MTYFFSIYMYVHIFIIVFYLPYYSNIRYVVLSFDEIKTHQQWLESSGQVHQGSLFQTLDVLLTYNSVTQPYMNELAKLTTKERFGFTLVRLRRNQSLEMLWDIFGIITGTGSRIFITWILIYFLKRSWDLFYLSQQRRKCERYQNPIASKRIALKIWEQ